MQRVHNLLGSKRAVYQPQYVHDAHNGAAEPEIGADFDGLGSQSYPRANGANCRSNRSGASGQSSSQAPQATGAPLISVGFQSLPGFASSSSSTSVNHGTTAAAPPSLFSGGRAPLKGVQNARPPCELCGGTDYRSRAPVTDRCVYQNPLPLEYFHYNKLL